jgi:hypothetical protein
MGVGLEGSGMLRGLAGMTDAAAQSDVDLKM